MFRKKTDLSTKQPSNIPPYTHCLNCGAELKGKYCHVCGQPATAKVPSIPAFIKIYFNHSLVWDPRFFSTLKTLVRRPGQLTNDYIAGKFTSQEHPIKLNMFLLFVFITMFVFFGSEKLSNSVLSLTEDDRYASGIQMEMIAGDTTYIERLKACSRDTVILHAPLAIATQHTALIANLETIHDSMGDSLDIWKAAVPRLLIEDGYLLPEAEGHYRIDTKKVAESESVQIVTAVWTQMVKFTTKYFPMMVLFTAPFVVFALRLVQRKEKRPVLHHLVFALHFTAILELLILCIYILYLVFALPIEVLQWILLIGACTYLTLAFRNVYGVSSWFKAIMKSVFTTLYYIFIILFTLIGVFLAACIAVADQFI